MFDFFSSSVWPNSAGPTVLIPAAPSTAYTPGLALVISGGVAVVADTTIKPTHICLETYTSPAADARAVKAFLINKCQVFKAPVSAKPTALKAGYKVTMNAGIGVTATAASGVATIVDKLTAENAGDNMLVRFE